MRPAGVGTSQPLTGRMRLAQGCDRFVESLSIEHGQPCQVAKLAKHAALVALGLAADRARDGVEIPGLRGERCMHQSRSFVGGPVEQRAQRRQCFARLLDQMLSVEARPLQHLLRGCEVAETEDAGERVIELRLLAIERVLELIV